MKCKFCGKELNEGSLFCGYCGKQQPKVKCCVKCGREIGHDYNFCRYCGAPQNTEVIIHEQGESKLSSAPVGELVEKKITPEMSVEQYPLLSNPEVILMGIIKELEKLNENYEKDFHLQEYTLSSQYLYSPKDEYNLLYDNYKKQIDEYNNNYKNKFNRLLKEAIKYDPLFTYPDLLKTNPIVVERFLNEPDYFQSAIDEIRYGWRRDNIFCIFHMLLLVFTCFVAFGLGSVLGEIDDNGLGWILFILAIGSGIFFRYVLKSALGGHKGITLAALSAASFVALFAFVFLPSEVFNGMAYVILFVYAICV